MEKSFEYQDEKFADVQMLRYRLKNFGNLALQQKKYIYYLSQATLCGRDITTDQFGKYNLQIRKLLEAVYLNYKGDKRGEDFAGLETYLKRVWFSNGIYHHYGCEKFVPGFSEDFLRNAVRSLGESLLPLAEGQSVDDMCSLLFPVIFNPSLYAKKVNKTAGDDLVRTSACNYYEGVSQKEAEAYYERMKNGGGDTPPSYGLNSKLVKNSGRLHEEVWNVESSYGQPIKQIIFWLKKAISVAENEQQRHVISLLVDYYTTGDLHTFDTYSIEWLNEQGGMVDFINGFIEVYSDPLGFKGSWEGIVTYKDAEKTKRTHIVSSNAQWFEDHSPVDARFKKKTVKGITANVVCAAMLGGDEYPSSAIGINLPNADWIRALHGSKSITISNLTEAYDKAAHGNGFNDEFIVDDETKSLVDRYGDICDDLHTDLHECLGHGSGQILPGVSSDALKEYGDTIEEARADLFGLYFIADKKMVELGLTPDANAFKAQYYTYMMNGLMTQLARIKAGHKIEEAHMRNRALIANWVLEHSDGCVAFVKQGGKTFVKISDYAHLRNLFATLLAEIQRIKSEGDYQAAKGLVENYAVNFDNQLHEEVVSRYSKLGIAPYKGFINPWLKPVLGSDGEIVDVDVDYSETFTHQMLRYSSEYGFL